MEMERERQGAGGERRERVRDLPSRPVTSSRAGASPFKAAGGGRSDRQTDSATERPSRFKKLLCDGTPPAAGAATPRSSHGSSPPRMEPPPSLHRPR